MFIEKLWKFLAPEGVATAAPATPGADTGAAPAPDAGSAAADHTPPAGSVDTGEAADTGERDLENLAPNSPEYREWQMKGKLPKKAAKISSEAAASTTAEEGTTQETTEGEESSTSSADAAESQTALKPPQKKDKESEKRYRDLVEQLRQKDLELERLRKPQETAAPKADPQTAAATEAQEPGMDDVDPTTGKPLYKTIGDYNKARDKWLLESFDKRTEQRQREKMSQEQARAVTDSYRNRIEKAREAHADFDQVALAENLTIPAGSSMEASIVLSEHGPEMQYLLGKNPAEALRISKLPPYEQAREMFLVELIAGGWDSRIAKDPRFAKKLSSAQPPKKITAIGQAPHEVGGSGQVLPDEVLQAATESETDPEATRRFIEADTRKAIARRKGK